MAYKIYSARVAMRLFLEESADLVFVTPNAIEAASKLFEEEENYIAANDIFARYESYREELACLLKDALG